MDYGVFLSMVMLVWCKKKDKRVIYSGCVVLTRKKMCAVLPNWMLGGLLSSFTSHCVSKVLFDFFLCFAHFATTKQKIRLWQHTLSCHYLLQYTSSSHTFLNLFSFMWNGWELLSYFMFQIWKLFQPGFHSWFVRFHLYYLPVG